MKNSADEKAFAKIDLAQTYYEDGAPTTALKLLTEASEILGDDTVAPFIKVCKADIKRRKTILRKMATK